MLLNRLNFWFGILLFWAEGDENPVARINLLRAGSAQARKNTCVALRTFVRIYLERHIIIVF